MSAWTEATVLRSWDETAELHGLRLEPGALAATHVRPGQFVEVKAGGVVAPFALASPPGQPHFELLVKRGSEATDALARAREGAFVTVSEANGAGFPVADFAGFDVVLAAVGTGIAPIRATLDWMLARRPDWKRIVVYYGQRRDEDFAYRNEHAAWRAAGVELELVRSSGHESARRYVQDAIRHGPLLSAHTVAFVCGMPEMTDAVTEALTGRGLPRPRVFLNV